MKRIINRIHELVSYKSSLRLLLALLPIFGLSASCRKILEVPLPINNLTTPQAFSTDVEANDAMSGVYYQMINTNGSMMSYAMTTFGGMSADELMPFNQNASDVYIHFQENDLTSSNAAIIQNFWTPAYSTIYKVNSILEGLNNSTTISDSARNELIGEAKFVRAFCNFYLVNLFGEVPLITSINWRNTNLLSRSDSAQIYQSILADLLDAKGKMLSDYSAGGGQRIVPNKWAATALLARVYLFMGDWQNAKLQADSVISCGLYSLATDLKTVFYSNSSEAIWQLQQSLLLISRSATPEGYQLIPRNKTTFPFVYLTTSLLNSFEVGDNRKLMWIDSTKYMGIQYYYPYKYQIGRSQASITGPYIEYYMVLRLAEQYLIRAEAEANGAGNGINDAIVDLNYIRSRANLLPYAGPVDQNSVLNAIFHERQIEFFSEWGHRWLDLKRTGQAVTTLSAAKKINILSSSLLYPIPISELQADPNLSQNPGY